MEKDIEELTEKINLLKNSISCKEKELRSLGRWFNDIRAFRAEPIHSQQYQQYQQLVYGPPVVARPLHPVAPGYAQGQGNGGNSNGNPPF